MGCCGSKKPKEPECDKTPDERTGLSECDRKLIKSSWSEAMPDDDAKLKNGVEFFIQLFTTYPAHQELFPNFQGKELTELGTSPELEDHARAFMNTIGSWVDAVDDPDQLLALFQEMDAKHFETGIKDKELEDMEGVFIPYLRSILGGSCTSEIEEAWSRLLKAHTASLRQYYEDKEAEGAAEEE